MPKYKIWQKQQNGTLKEIGITDEIDTSSFYSPSNPPNKVKDKYNNAETFLAYSKEILAKDVTYLGAWSGYELRAIHRNQFVCTSVGQGLSDSEKTMARNNIDAMPYISINEGLMAESSSSDWGVNIGTQVAGWNYKSGGSFKFRKDCPNAGQMSLVINGTVFVNEGNERVYSASYLPQSVKDIDDGSETTFAYSKPRIPINDVTWIAVWNGFELRRLHKDEVLNYNLLSNRPTSLPASDVYPWAKQSSKPSYSASEISGLSSVAKTGNYDDLVNKPTIPSVYNSTIQFYDTIGGKTQNINLNQPTNKTISFEIPKAMYEGDAIWSGSSQGIMLNFIKDMGIYLAISDNVNVAFVILSDDNYLYPYFGSILGSNTKSNGTYIFVHADIDKNGILTASYRNGSATATANTVTFKQIIKMFDFGSILGGKV